MNLLINDVVWFNVAPLVSSELRTGNKTAQADRQQELDHIPQHAAVCVSAGMCVGEKAEKTKQRREKNEGDHRKWPNALKGNSLPSRLFCPDISAPFLTNAALWRPTALIVALGHRSEICSSLLFLGLALKVGRERQKSVRDKHFLCVFFRTMRPSSMPERTMLFMLF